MKKIIDVRAAVPRFPAPRFQHPVDFSLLEGEQLAIVGRNGAGKSMLVDVLTGRHPLMSGQMLYDFSPTKQRLVSDNMKYIAFRDSYGPVDGTYYYQQRWNQHDIDEEVPCVGQLLDEAFAKAEESLRREARYTQAEVEEILSERHAIRKHLYEMFHWEKLLDKRIIFLSSGELRKFQLTKTLMTNPRLLIMDNPFVGLDADARAQLTDLLTMLTSRTALQVVLVLSKTDGVPDFISHVVQVEDMKVGEKEPRTVWQSAQVAPSTGLLDSLLRKQILELPTEDAPSAEDGVVVDFRHVNIRYGDRTILSDLSLTVRKGEHWVLAGENGAGKSTLLSLVCADNPQAYANDIVLFGRERGSGESIWEIKRHIGYISPEMHRAYLKDMPAVRIVASGLHDSVGLYVKPKAEQMEQCVFWMNVFGLGAHVETPFLRLSSGEQRLVLLARAFVKNPALLILDEPFHGLDLHNRQLVREVIETYCQRPDHTLVMVTHYRDELPVGIDHEIFLRRHL